MGGGSRDAGLKQSSHAQKKSTGTSDSLQLELGVALNLTLLAAYVFYGLRTGQITGRSVETHLSERTG
jgi:hypothetical protein